MWGRNNASPNPVLMGELVSTTDGSLATSSASARIKLGTGAWGAASGTLDCDATSGTWTYLPTQAETNTESFIVAVYKTGYKTISQQVVTSKSSTFGYAGLDWANISSPTTTVALTGTTISSSQVAASVTGNVGGDVVGSVGSVATGVTVDTNNDKTGYSLSQSFPTHFANMQIAANGHVSSVVESMANNSITASAIQGDAITAAKIAADAVTEIQSGLATSANQTTILDRQAYTLAVLAGACSDPQTSAETYVLTIGGSTYTVDMAGQTSTGTRTAPTLTKS